MGDDIYFYLCALIGKDCQRYYRLNYNNKYSKCIILRFVKDLDLNQNFIRWLHKISISINEVFEMYNFSFIMTAFICSIRSERRDVYDGWIKFIGSL